MTLPRSTRGKASGMVRFSAEPDPAMPPQPSQFDTSHMAMLQGQIRALEERSVDPREFGHLEQQVEQLIVQMAELQKTMGQISNTLSEAKGGWRTLMLLGGAGAAVGGLLTWMVQHIRIAP